MLLPATTMVVSLAVALGACVLLGRGGPGNGLLLVAVMFLFLAYGPAVNILVDNTFYRGINLGTIAEPVIGFGLAALAILLGHWAVPQKRVDAPARSPRHFVLLDPLLAVTAAYGVFVLVTRLSGSLGANKLVQVALAGAWHYPYLLLQILTVATYFLCRTRLSRGLWVVNLAVYVSYALATSERDFLFVLAAVLVHRESFVERQRNMRAVLAGFAAVLVGTLLATSRQATGGGSLVSSVLNQGSILFIDSHVSLRVPETIPLALGQTYVDALGRPFGATDATPLADWFVSWYAPNSPSGYGFSLTGEALLNFGLWGIPIVFFLLSVLHRILMNRSGRSDISCYMSVVFLATWLYALRGDFAQLFSTMLYAALIFAVLSWVRVDTNTSARKTEAESAAIRPGVS